MPNKADSSLDVWAKWLLQRRHAGDEERLKRTMEYLYPVRDKLLENVHLAEGMTLLDVGCGDGLVAFGALAKYPVGKVIFSDISQDLLDVCRQIAADSDTLERCEFVCASVEDLSALADSSVDAVTMRSVLIYVKDKPKAFSEFYRVLRPGGWVSIFEPINSFGYPEPEHLFWGYDITPIRPIIDKVKAVYNAAQPPDDPMLDFTERHLVDIAERTGFREMYLELRVEIAHFTDGEPENWEHIIEVAGNPRSPTLKEAMLSALSPDEIITMTEYLRPKVESSIGSRRWAIAYVWGKK